MATAVATAPPAADTSSVRSDDSHTRPLRSRFFQWVPTDDQQVRVVEQRLLSGLTYTERNLAGINTISSASWDSPSNGKKATVVLIHGFAGGLGSWAQNWDALTKHYNVHAIDLPGFGRSMRDDRSFKGPQDAMRYYYDALHKWFGEAGIPPHQPITLVGHSFGGYISSHYAMEMLWRKRKLEDATGSVVADHMCLASHVPAAKVKPSSSCSKNHNAAAPPTSSSPQDTAIPKVAVPPPNIVHVVLADPWGVPPKHKREMPLKFRILIKLFYKMSPLAIVRCAGPWGPNLLPKVRPDFAERWNHLPDPLIFYDYTYHCNAQTPATGELAFQACCEGAAFAKLPLMLYLPTMLKSIASGVDTTDQLFEATASNKNDNKKKGHDEDVAAAPPAPTPVTMTDRAGKTPKTPNTGSGSVFAAGGSKPQRSALPNLTLLHGDHTWMDTAMYQRLVDQIVADGTVGNVSIGSIVNAGHQLNTDNADDFNDKLDEAIRRGLRGGKA